MVEDVLTEESSIKKVLSSNIEILEASKELEFASQKVIEAKGLYLPKVNANMNLSRFYNVFSTVVADLTSQSFVILPEGKQDLRYCATLSVWQNIYTGGRIKTANKVARVNEKKIENKTAIIRNKIVNNVKVIFNECLYYKNLLSMDLEKLKSVELGRTRLSLENIKNLRKKCIEEQLLYEKEVLNLISVVGGDLNTSVEIKGKLLPKIKQLDLQHCLFLSYQFNQKLRSSQNQETIDNLTLNLLSLQKFPNVTLGCAYEWAGQEPLNLNSSWYASFNINIPVFDGGIMFSKLKQGTIKLRQTVLARSKAERDSRLDVSKSFLEYNFWKNRAIESNLLKKNHYDQEDIELIRNLNKSYYNLELAVGVDLDLY
jgi:outer membrane protein TolC